MNVASGQASAGALAGISPSRDALCRVAPFAAFMLLIALEEAGRFLAGRGGGHIPESVLLAAYPVKVVIAGGLLAVCWRRYGEIIPRDLARVGESCVSVAVGLLVFVAWIHMDWPLFPQAVPPGYNPLLAPEAWRPVLFAFRLLGAVLIVPIFEELFWRSFLSRYLIRQDFMSVPLGRFTGWSLAVSILLFGSAHHYAYAGMLAGAAYCYVLRRTRSIGQCILAHATTNLCLGVYTIATGQWSFW